MKKEGEEDWTEFTATRLMSLVSKFNDLQSPETCIDTSI